MTEVRESRVGEGPALVTMWERAVDATHHFLAPADRLAIGAEVALFLPQAPAWVAVDGRDRAVGFMLMSDGVVDALFVDPALHGHGIGTALLAHALARHGELAVDVNEQNDAALAFYERRGFVRTGRSEVDGQGRAYPLIHLHLRRSA